MSARKTKSDRIGLKDAYGLQTPEDSRALYAKWAENYDEDFVAAHDYTYHSAISRLLVAHLDPAIKVPRILDIGCGTGLVGEALHALLPAARIDGMDISPEMLGAAKKKGVYDQLLEVDLTRAGSIPAGYDGIVSSGIFTHGHLGPEVLDTIVDAGDLFVLGINAELFTSAGFDKTFDALTSAGKISDLRYETGRIYEEGASHDHADARFQAAIFRAA
ncbi:MAG: class I SAM-dependent methyltransferase [Pseudomonadota bacterium]